MGIWFVILELTTLLAKFSTRKSEYYSIKEGCATCVAHPSLHIFSNMGYKLVLLLLFLLSLYERLS